MGRRECHRPRTGRRTDTKREIATIYFCGQQVRVGNSPRRRPGQQKNARTPLRKQRNAEFFFFLFR